MTEPSIEWDAAYRQETPPPWSIGRPQPELAVLIDRGKIRSDVLDSGCGHAALSLALAARGYTVIGLDASPTAVAAATAAAVEPGLDDGDFRAGRYDVSFRGYDARFSTILDSGLLHVLPPEKRRDYLESISSGRRAPGAALHILAFAAGASVTGRAADAETELRDAVSTLWRVDDLRPRRSTATLSALAAGRLPNVEHDNEGHFLAPGFLISAHKPKR